MMSKESIDYCSLVVFQKKPSGKMFSLYPKKNAPAQARTAALEKRRRRPARIIPMPARETRLNTGTESKFIIFPF